jgi:heptose-I-phosphate ethanolaminephosphotransferase
MGFWLRFLGFGLLLHVAAGAAGFMLAKDLAKMALWWAIGGSALMLACQPLSARARQRVWLAMVLWWGLDIGTQGVVRGYFGAAPQPGVIAESLANTTPGEIAGFLGEQWSAIGRGLSFAALAVAAAVALMRGRFTPADGPAWTRGRSLALAALALVFVALHFNPTMLRQQPLLRWGVVLVRHAHAQQEIARIGQDRAAVQTGAAGWQVRALDPGPRTVVLVIGESATRFNWGLHGYARDTTAPLVQALAALPGRAVFFEDAWSAQAFTLPSLKLALTPATQDEPGLWNRTPDITQLAQAAGYHVTWLSNQPAHEGWFAAMARTAQQQRFVNSGNWRDSSATDADLLPPLREHLAAAAPAREFIVVHLLGQHFHYKQRCPADTHPFRDLTDDAVARGLRAAGRSAGIVQARNEYDDAVYCGSQVLGQMLKLLNAQRPGRALEVMFFSDHGQEVGHRIDFAGHSQSERAGYAIPMFWWSRTPGAAAPPPDLARRPFRLDWADHALQHLLAIESAWYRRELDVLDPAYAPKVPVEPVLDGADR